MPLNNQPVVEIPNGVSVIYATSQHLPVSIKKKSLGRKLPVLPDLSFSIGEYHALSMEKPPFMERKDIEIGVFNFTYRFDTPEDEYVVGKLVRVPDSLFVLNPYSQDYYIRADGERVSIREFNIDEDTTIIQVFSKLKPEVFSPPRVLTEFLSGMEDLMLNMLDYELLESPYLYSSKSPYIHIGTKMNRVIYPTSIINLKGKRGRYGSY